MTLAIAITADDGIVLAADSEESTGYPGFSKGSTQKIFTYGFYQAGANPPPILPGGICAIAGAGDAAYIESLTEKIGSTFLDDPSLNLKQLEEAFAKTLWKFYRDHVIPFAKFPDADRPNLNLIIAAQRGPHPHLYVTNKNTVRHGFPCAAVGCGEIFAKTLLGNLWRGGQTKQIEALAVYVVLMAKAQVEGIGKSTCVVTLHGWTIQESPTGSVLAPPNQAVSYMPQAKVNELEHRFATELAPRQREDVWKFIQALG